MNDKKIAFIYCYNDEDLLNESILYIQSLHIPIGYEIEIIPVENAKSMTSGYNYAMQRSDAKYKVYLHQDVFIINKAFIENVLELFKHNQKVGMIGVVGAKEIPINGVWWDAQTKYGKVYDSHRGVMELLSFEETSNHYEVVQAIDGLTMITQYDIPWREDLFTGWHFYDVSQSIEFLKNGYEVIVPQQNEPWCVHDCGIVNVKNGYEENRNIFLGEYSKQLFPLVSVLIPTFNRPDYLKEALVSVINQTYRNLEIIIGDDSTNNETEKLINDEFLGRYDTPIIKYFHNETNLGQFKNDLKLLEVAEGEYINFLMDDDLFEKTKIEKMMNYFILDQNQEFSLVTSHRGLIDGNGDYKGIFGNTDYFFNKDTIISGIELGDLLIKTSTNFIGEPTTVLFRKNALLEPFGIFNNREYGPNVDQASWLNLLSAGSAVYINEVLSYFRIHESQQQNSKQMIYEGYIDHAHKLLTCRRKGFMKNNGDFLKAIEDLLIQFNAFDKDFNQINDSKEFEINKYFTEIQLYKEKLSSLYKEVKKELPLVSVLIPAYNQTKYLKEALESVINQTYPHIEIIIGDDSTNDEVKEFLKPYLNQYKHITYFKNEKKSFDYGFTNHVNCFKASKGEYINYLSHDDVFHPEKIERMMKYFFEKPNLTLVTSVRQPIDELGNELALDGAFTRLVNKDTYISGIELSRIVLTNLVNVIGEPTSVLFKRRYMEEGKYGFINDVRFLNISDLANWLNFLQYGDAVYMTDTLSYFRMHQGQNSTKPDVHMLGVINWYRLVKYCYELGVIQNRLEYKTIIYKWLSTQIPVLTNFINSNQYVTNELTEQLITCYKEAMDDLVNNNTGKNHECPVCENMVERFLPYQYKKHKSDFIKKFQIIGSDTDNFSCPECMSHDRMRHLMLYFNKLDIWRNKIQGKKVLHIAPEYHLQQFIEKIDTNEYIRGDLFPTNDSIIKMDINNIPFSDNYFDFIICNHVLEHIPDDNTAMKELNRVLKAGGSAVLQTPYSPILSTSFEDNSIDTAIKRKEYYGQDDHVRVYGTDFISRLELVGFKLNIIQNSLLFSEAECKKYGVNPKEDLLLVTK